MISFTTNVAIPNLTRAKLKLPSFDDDNNVATFALEIGGAGGRIYAVLTIIVRDGACQGVRTTVGPATFDDFVQAFALTVASGYTAVVAAYNGATGGVGARLKAAETSLLAQGIITIAGTVS